MFSNYHTHTTFCDGANTPEEMVLSAIKKNMSALGFSGHGFTGFDSRYCMRDTDGYIKEINRLKEVYKNDIEIYLGIEEDANHPCDRSKFDYIIGSSHYSVKDGKYYPIDSSHDYFKECLKAWNGDTLAFAEEYYSRFCDYIIKRKPDIIGHFDLLTKYDELECNFLNNPQYCALAERAAQKVLDNTNCIFEVNTGAISRGYRTAPYPSKNILSVIKKNGGRVILNSDSHNVDTLDCSFDKAIAILKEIGFKTVWELHKNGFEEKNI